MLRQRGCVDACGHFRREVLCNMSSSEIPPMADHQPCLQTHCWDMDRKLDLHDPHCPVESTQADQAR